MTGLSSLRWACGLGLLGLLGCGSSHGGEPTVSGGRFTIAVQGNEHYVARVVGAGGP